MKAIWLLAIIVDVIMLMQAESSKMLLSAGDVFQSNKKIRLLEISLFKSNNEMQLTTK